MSEFLKPITVAGISAGFPTVRPRRLRRTSAMRELVRETNLSVTDVVYPVFVTHGRDVRAPIAPMPGQSQLSLDHLLEEASEAVDLGIQALLLFGLPARKDELGTEAYAENGIIQEAVSALKHALPNLLVITDVCLCEYTDHGHCGVLLDDGTVDNDETLQLLAKTAVSHAEAGADIVAPSAMMDGQIAALRQAIDSAGHGSVALMA